MPLFDTQLPEMPNTLWYGDGTKLNLYYKDYDKKQKRMVARTIDAYEVMDACTEVFWGIHSTGELPRPNMTPTAWLWKHGKSSHTR